ncbi:DUF805 domain-containing protein [Paremcibacter congregatus]|uniref:DUF805 domain-containing protein n=1 Tax=Paremcibacter congregatus TaxID=2043170 RepID=A0A2G4YTU4_9PROT|nr:DUF805 domain-containing protein [Paremcibacter congregatus]PHZ85670.1 DUF805 domain-containing protein [Paremcibacter congregatus]QDE26630.1 DUF805 domain-containing protein [Paremcibacter congregatus]|tara:strand:- start:9829 stop:10203 length:375 start_codon:yes stop_codon:yes gene_type:complete
MEFSEAVKSVFSKFATFSGRAARSEYWYFQLFIFLVQIAITILTMVVPFLALLSLIFALITILPGLAVSVRRLHDKNKSGWWLLLCFIPLVGAIILLIWFAMAGTEGPNEYGDDPLADPAEVFA